MLELLVPGVPGTLQANFAGSLFLSTACHRNDYVIIEMVPTASLGVAKLGHDIPTPRFGSLNVHTVAWALMIH